MAAHPQPKFTEEQYLALERAADYKSEFVGGFIYAMAGATLEHVAITANVVIALGSQLRGTPCRAFSADLRVRVAPTGMYTYPDVLVLCGEPEFHDGRRDTVTNPTLIVEVLSPSTEAYDRGDKFAHYRTVETLREYVLVSQDRRRVERYLRQSDGEEWRYRAVEGVEAELPLESVNAVLRLFDVYDRIEIAPNAPPPGEHGPGPSPVP